jgi:hypothetical protein
MTITPDTQVYSRDSTVDSGPTFTALDIFAGFVATVMILGTLTAAGTHASHQGWPTEQSQTR